MKRVCLFLRKVCSIRTKYHDHHRSLRKTFSFSVFLIKQESSYEEKHTTIHQNKHGVVYYQQRNGAIWSRPFSQGNA